MSRFQKIAFLGLLLAIGALVYVEATQPPPLSWYPSYNADDKIPYGTKIIHELLEEAIPEQLEDVTLPPYEFLQNDSLRGSYLFVNNSIQFDKEELEEMMQWTEKGNKVFIAANNLPSELLDTLEIETTTAYLLQNINTQPMLELTNLSLKEEKPFLLDRDIRVPYFDKIDTLYHIGLGVTQIYNDTLQINAPLLNFLEVPHGTGAFYLHCQPEVFTNYFMVKDDNAQYTQKALAYLHDGNPIFWDRYYKSGKRFDISPLHVLLGNKYFKWAYYFVLIGVLLFVLFEGKRKQRNIPIIQPPTNKTYEYTQTIAGMYFNRKDYKGIAEKQVALFMDYIRTQLRMPTERINKSFMVQLASRTGNDLETTEALFNTITTLQKANYITKEQLVSLHQKISDYKNKLHGTERSTE